MVLNDFVSIKVRAIPVVAKCRVWRNIYNLVRTIISEIIMLQELDIITRLPGPLLDFW